MQFRAVQFCAFAVVLTCCVGCTSFSPFVDARREAGIVETIGKSKTNAPAICYNALVHDRVQVDALADEVCAQSGKHAVYEKTAPFSCSLISPSMAFYRCE